MDTHGPDASTQGGRALALPLEPAGQARTEWTGDFDDLVEIMKGTMRRDWHLRGPAEDAGPIFAVVQPDAILLIRIAAHWLQGAEAKSKFVKDVALPLILAGPCRMAATLTRSVDDGKEWAVVNVFGADRHEVWAAQLQRSPKVGPQMRPWKRAEADAMTAEWVTPISDALRAAS